MLMLLQPIPSDENWSAGPPTEDNVLQIQKITGWYKTA